MYHFARLFMYVIRRLLLALMLVAMVSAPANTALAKDVKPATHLPSKTVPTDPNRPLTPAERKLRDAKYKALDDFIHSIEISPSGGVPASLVLSVGTWKEPNDWAHINHCGPGATQVALDARWPASRVYDIDRIGGDEETNVGGLGTTMADIAATLNSSAYLGNEFPNPNGMQGYWLDFAHDDSNLFYKIEFDITHGYALITGVRTETLLGWYGYGADHIVAVINYQFANGVGYVTYTDTASKKAGYYGAYRNTMTLQPFYNAVVGLNTLIW